MVGSPTPPLLDLDQAGGMSLVLVHPHAMQCPAFQKSPVMVQGMLQATDSPDNVPLHQRDNRAQTFLHGAGQDSHQDLPENLFAEGRREREEKIKFPYEQRQKKGQKSQQRKAKSRSER
jgi:hypothetical protein